MTYSLFLLLALSSGIAVYYLRLYRRPLMIQLVDHPQEILFLPLDHLGVAKKLLEKAFVVGVGNGKSESLCSLLQEADFIPISREVT